MRFSMIKPFVLEMVVFVFSVGCVLGGLLVGDFIEISFRIHLLTVVAFIIVMFFLLSSFSRIINTGVRALTDYFLQDTKEDVYTFLKEEPYRASVFAERFNHERELDYGMYYLVHVKKENVIYTFLSPAYLELIEEKEYIIKTGRCSNIVLSINNYI